MEFLSLSRRRSSSRNVPQRRWARRNVCRSQARTEANFFFGQHSDADANACGTSSAGYKRNLKYQIKQACFYFDFDDSISCRKQRWKIGLKIRDSKLAWLKRVTDFRSHAKGHTILCDVYYLLTNDWTDERFSKSKSLVCDEFSFLQFFSRLR